MEGLPTGVLPMGVLPTRESAYGVCLQGVGLPMRGLLLGCLPMGVCLQGGLRTGVCLRGGCADPPDIPGILPDTVNKGTVRTLLECFLVEYYFNKLFSYMQ